MRLLAGFLLCVFVVLLLSYSNYNPVLIMDNIYETNDEFMVKL